MATSPTNHPSTPAANVAPIPVPVDVTRILSGAIWCASFPGSSSLDDLQEPFKAGFVGFLSALNKAGATTQINQTFRPVERAYMMHYCYVIKNKTQSPKGVDRLPGVNIEWDHGDDKKSIKAASEMSTGFGIDNLKTEPALNSQHTIGFAVDMQISWEGDLSIEQKDGTTTVITSSPKDIMNPDLHKVGKTYGVIKYNKSGYDRPHWSSNGA